MSSLVSVVQGVLEDSNDASYLGSMVSFVCSCINPWKGCVHGGCKRLHECQDPYVALSVLVWNELVKVLPGEAREGEDCTCVDEHWWWRVGSSYVLCFFDDVGNLDCQCLSEGLDELLKNCGVVILDWWMRNTLHVNPVVGCWV